MAESPRIEELKRRVQVDPASIAFAALAEEYRRAGRFEEAIATCEAGLQRHPAYLSAHVTLGRALLELGRFDDARQELEHVLRAAPENLAAIRGLAEIHHRRGELPEALEQYRSALHVAKHDTEVEQAIDATAQPSEQVTPPETGAAAAEPVQASAPEPEPEHAPEPESPREPAPRPRLALVSWPPPATESEPEAAAEPEPEPAVLAPNEATSEAHAASMAVGSAEAPADARQDRPDPALAALEGLLAAILREKDSLASTSAAGR